MKSPETITAYPLTWPVGHKRTTNRKTAAFGRRKHKEYGYSSGQWRGYRDITIAEARDELIRQVGLMNGTRLTISSNLELRNDGLPRSGQRKPSDPGVAAYFFRHGKPYVLACDAWDSVECNLYAIALHVDALRGQERWGVGSLEQSMRGYELPSSTAPGHWSDVLNVARDATLEQIERAYRDLVKAHHPDRGGDHERMAAINAAYAQAREDAQ
jgi:hypothetical protein